MRLNDILTEFGQYYNTLEKRDTKLYDKYYGRNIIWLGEKGKMLRATPYNSEPVWGNIFDSEKIEQTSDDIETSEDRIEFYAPLGHPTIIDIQDVEENLQADAHDDLMYDPAINDSHTYSTEDDELDAYLLDAEEFLDDNSVDDDDMQSLEKEMEQRKAEAQEDEWGDIGEISIQVRDGNHRRTAAFASGEKYIWVRVSDDVMGDLDPHIVSMLE